MPEVQKYNLKEKLMEADEKYAHSPAVAGSNSMTFFRYNNSTRTQMFTAHLNQILNGIHCEFPFVFGGAENVVGKHSSGYKQTKNDITIFRKVVKFEDLVDRPYVYQLFYWDEKKKQYDVFERTEVKDLGQDYGYGYNNEVIDSLAEGDFVPKGTVLYKSLSYDESMNYRYGVNLNVIYTLDPFTAEDAAIISETASEKMTTIHSTKIGWGWNNNDIPLNIYGGEEEYRPLPWIGEHIEGFVTSCRPQINEQLAYDFSHRNLSKMREGDRTIEYNGKGIVIDYDIYCNNPDIKPTTFNAQILMLLESQNKYWQEIKDTCTEIMASGKDYSRKVDLLYKKSMEFLDPNPNRKWNNGSSVFGNLEFRAHVIEYTPLRKGGKFTARYGNKSVVSEVRPDYLMPFTPDGRHADVILNLLAITNRTTAFVPHEMHINWYLDCTRREMAKKKTLKEKEKLLFDAIKRLNKDQYEQMYPKYKGLSKEKQEEYIQSCIDNGIYTHQDMINEDESIFYKLVRIEQEVDYLKPDDLYVYRWGHVYRMNQRFYMGKMYFFPLKQTDQRGFSVRATGAINMKGLPERSYKNKRNEAAFSDTAIRFGEYEAMNFLIGLQPDELVCMEAMYRTSPEASSDLTNAQFVKKRTAQFKKYYKSRAAEIFTVLYKHLGLELDFRNKYDKLEAIDSHNMSTHTYDGKTYICSDYDFYLIELRDKIKDAILREHMLLSGDALEKMIDEEMEHAYSIIGQPNNHNIFGTKEELTDDPDPEVEEGKKEKEEVTK